jgi:hypothetical protein
MRSKDPLKQILEKTQWYWDHSGILPDVRAAFRKVLQCRTAELGAEVFASENGEVSVYHTCKSRACSSCGHWATLKWQQERRITLPPVLYKGITFTMPKSLWHVFRKNRSLVEALPALAAGAIGALIKAKYGLSTGIIAIPHTFDGQFNFNSHVHSMVTAGGWHASSKAWIRSVYYDRDGLMSLWRTSVLELLRKSLRLGLLTIEKTSEEMEAMLVAEERWWSVRIQSFDSVDHFLEYGGRYARRPPIARRRIIYIGERTILFWKKDKRSGKIINVLCSLAEFVSRWAQHILSATGTPFGTLGCLLPGPRAKPSMGFSRPLATSVGHDRLLYVGQILSSKALATIDT